MSKEHYKRIKWTVKPSSGIVALPTLCDAIDYQVLPKSETPKIPKVIYICKNCNGHINPTTMKCEYCDTQY